jgi:hypothetical protein
MKRIWKMWKNIKSVKEYEKMCISVAGWVDIPDDLSSSVNGPPYVLRWRVSLLWLVLVYSHVERAECTYLTHCPPLEYSHLHHPCCNLSLRLRRSGRPPHQGILMQASENMNSHMHIGLLWLCASAQTNERFRETGCVCLQGNQASHHSKTRLSNSPLLKLKSQIILYFTKCFPPPNATSCPYGLRGLSSGCGQSVTDFWGWVACEVQLRCPDEVDGDTWILTFWRWATNIWVVPHS